MTTPEIEQDIPSQGGVDGVLLRSAYSEGMVADLKSEIPRESRRWAPDLEGWWIEASHLDTAIHITLRYFPSVQVLGVGGEDDQLISRDGSRASQGRLL